VSDPRATASDPSTPAAALASLASSGDRELRRCVASNPNAPLSLLLALAQDFPDQILTNPAFALALLDDPTLLAQTPARWALAASPALPAFLAHHLFELRDEGVRLALARNPATPAEILDISRKSPGESMRAALAFNPITDLATLRLYLGDSSPQVRKCAAANPSIPDAWRLRMARLGLAGDLAGFPEVWGPHEEDDLPWLAGGGPWLLALLSLYPVLPAGLCESLGRGEIPSLVLPQRVRYGRWQVDGVVGRAHRLSWGQPGTHRLSGDQPRPPREIPEESWWLLAPSLRAPMSVVRWHQPGGSSTSVELRSGEGMVNLQAPAGCRVRPWVSGGPVTPGQPLARLWPGDEGSFDGRPARLPELSLLDWPVLGVPVPSLGESVCEATLYHWEVKPGDVVRADQVLVSAQLDKCDIELRAPFDAVVMSVVPGETTVRPGDTFVLLSPLVK